MELAGGGCSTKRRLRLYGGADAADQDVLSWVGVRSFSRAWGEYQVAGAFGRLAVRQKTRLIGWSDT